MVQDAGRRSPICADRPAAAAGAAHRPLPARAATATAQARAEEGKQRLLALPAS